MQGVGHQKASDHRSLSLRLRKNRIVLRWITRRTTIKAQITWITRNAAMTMASAMSGATGLRDLFPQNPKK